MEKQQNSRFILLTLMFTMMVDVMGVGLVLPLMPELFFSSSHSIMHEGIPQFWQNLLYGFTLCVWPLAGFLGTPYFGDLSDKISRKTILIVCQMGTMLTYFLGAWAVLDKSLWLFIVARAISGFFSGSVAIAQAMTIDISDQKNKTKNLGFLTLSFAVGIVIGPIIAGLATRKGMWLDGTLALPFIVAGCLALLNTASIFCFLKKTLPSNPHAHVKLLKGFVVLFEVMKDIRTRCLLIVSLMLQLGWGLYLNTLSLVLHENFSYTASMNAWAFTVFGTSSVIGIVVLQPIMLSQFSIDTTCLISGIVTGSLIIFSMFVHTLSIQWLVVAIAPGVQVMFYNALLTKFSNAVEAHEQGRMMGGVDASACLAWGLNSFLVGIMVDFHLWLPLIVGGISIIMAGLYFSPIKRNAYVKH
ncbi:MAG: MFS transporter [Gammaproteobacteria bacterium]